MFPRGYRPRYVLYLDFHGCMWEPWYNNGVSRLDLYVDDFHLRNILFFRKMYEYITLLDFFFYTSISIFD